MKKRILLVANNCEWSTWQNKINELKTWFSSKVDLQIDIIHTSHQNIPFIQYENPVPDQAQYKKRLGVDYGWYDAHVSSLATGYDIVLFVVNSSQWPAEGDMRGWRVDRTNGAVELQIGVGEFEQFQWGRYKGDGFFNFARHEIMHALFMITGQNDTTHFWWNQSPEKLIFALNELVFVDPREADQISRLQKIIAILQAILGLQQKINSMVDGQKDNPTKRNFCLAIQEYEGYFAPGENPKHPNGSFSWRNNNPGNLRYANQVGSTGENRGFAVFPDYETGFNALMRQVELAISGKSRVYSPEMDLIQFFNVYAPSSDNNNPFAYADFVAKKLGVSREFKIKDLA